MDMKRILLILPLLLLALPTYAAIGSLTITSQLLDNRTDPGGENIIFLTFTNPSTSLSIYDLKVTVSTGPQLTAQTNYFTVGSLGYGNSQLTSVKFKVNESATPMISYITVKAQYYREGGTQEESIITAPVIIGKEPILQIQSEKFDPSPQPGSVVKLNFDLINVGKIDATNIRVSVNQSASYISEPNEVFINNLATGEKKSLSFIVSIDPKASAGIYAVPVFITYDDGTKLYTYRQAKNIGLTIKSPIELIATLESTKGLYYGKSGTVTITIANRGKAAAEFLLANIWSAYGKKDTYIGKLDTDDYQTVDIAQDLASAKEPYTLYLNLSYKDTFSKEYSVQKSVYVVPTTAPQETPTFYYVILIFAVILVIWIVSKKRKK